MNNEFPDMILEGCATDRQMSFAQSIADELGIDLPNEHTKWEISEFISKNKREYYSARGKRLGGYAAIEKRIDEKIRRV